MTLNRERKGGITEIYHQVYEELKEKYEGKNIPIMALDNIIKRKLGQARLNSRENLIYIRGYFRKNRILTYNIETGYLKWNV